jgi:hypothetical protein
MTIQSLSIFSNFIYLVIAKCVRVKVLGLLVIAEFYHRTMNHIKENPNNLFLLLKINKTLG